MNRTITSLILLTTVLVWGCASTAPTVSTKTVAVPVPARSDTGAVLPPYQSTWFVRTDTGFTPLPDTIQLVNDSTQKPVGQIVGNKSAKQRAIINHAADTLKYTFPDTNKPIIQIEHNPTTGQKINWMLVGVGALVFLLVIAYLVSKFGMPSIKLPWSI